MLLLCEKERGERVGGEGGGERGDGRWDGKGEKKSAPRLYVVTCTCSRGPSTPCGDVFEMHALQGEASGTTVAKRVRDKVRETESIAGLTKSMTVLRSGKGEQRRGGRRAPYEETDEEADDGVLDSNPQIGFCLRAAQPHGHAGESAVKSRITRVSDVLRCELRPFSTPEQAIIRQQDHNSHPKTVHTHELHGEEHMDIVWHRGIGSAGAQLVPPLDGRGRGTKTIAEARKIEDEGRVGCGTRRARGAPKKAVMHILAQNVVQLIR